jgi:hypothetical protein
VLSLFPELAERDHAFSQAARVCLKPHEADLLCKLMVA